MTRRLENGYQHYGWTNMNDIKRKLDKLQIQVKSTARGQIKNVQHLDPLGEIHTNHTGGDDNLVYTHEDYWNAVQTHINYSKNDIISGNIKDGN